MDNRLLNHFYSLALGIQAQRKFKKKTRIVASAVVSLFKAFEGSMSTRQVFYQMVSQGLIPNSANAYESLQRLVVTLRRVGLVGYDRVVDRTRSKHHRSGWDGVEDLLASAAQAYRRDYWASQDVLPVIACEKAALEGVIGGVVDEFGTPLWVLRGYPSESYVYEWANELQQLSADGREIRIFYFGDADPSGLHIEASTIEKLREHGADFEWTRSGLLFEDFKAYDLVNIDVKLTDSRAKSYLTIHGNQAAELDALPPKVLADRVRACIMECIDAASWERVRLAEAAERESLIKMSSNWETVLSAVAKVR